MIELAVEPNLLRELFLASSSIEFPVHLLVLFFPYSHSNLFQSKNLVSTLYFTYLGSTECSKHVLYTPFGLVKKKYNGPGRRMISR